MTYKRLNKDDAVVLLVDHQTGLISLVQDFSPNEFKNNVLALADVSIAMGQGALVTRAQADAVVASNRLGDLVLAHDLAKRCMAVVRQNMLWAATYNAVCIPLALVGWLPPWAAGLGMATSSVLVIGNSMRLARPLQLDPNTQLTQPDMQPPTGALRAFPPEGEASPGATAVRN